jgi:hypothetical protein
MLYPADPAAGPASIQSSAGEMRSLLVSALLILCCIGLTAAFSVVPSQNIAAKIVHKSASPRSFAQTVGLRRRVASPVLALRANANDEDSKGGPLGYDSDLTPKESVDPSLFVIFGILGEIELHLFGGRRSDPISS